jgi:hypothetical protein
MLNHAHEAFGGGEGGELDVVLEELGSGLGEEDVHVGFEGVFGDLERRRVSGREEGGGSVRGVKARRGVGREGM